MSGSITQIPVVGQAIAGLGSEIGSALSSLGISSGPSDTRVRLDALNPAAVYQTSPIMSILTETGGVLFPYTPSITVSNSVDYVTLGLTHSNTDYQAYTKTPSVKLSITAKFSVQNYREARYALACIHFFRTVSKSYFGEKDAIGFSIPLGSSNLLNAPISTLIGGNAGTGNAGLPPPVLLFSGYGNLMFNRLRVILNASTLTLDESVDYVQFPINSGLLSILSGGGIAGGVVKLPAMFSISCDLTVIQTPKRMRQQFSFEDFASGKLLSSSDGGWI